MADRIVMKYTKKNGIRIKTSVWYGSGTFFPSYEKARASADAWLKKRKTQDSCNDLAK